jgi:hypothetical protein
MNPENFNLEKRNRFKRLSANFEVFKALQTGISCDEVKKLLYNY